MLLLIKFVKKILMNDRLQQNLKYSGHLKNLIVGLSDTRVTRVVGLLEKNITRDIYTVFTIKYNRV
jgi:hypothetical protein